MCDQLKEGVLNKSRGLLLREGKSSVKSPVKKAGVLRMEKKVLGDTQTTQRAGG